MSLSIRPARSGDEALILAFIRKLAEYEKLVHEVVADETLIAETLFAPQPKAFCDIAEWNGESAGYALWFYNYSTFHARHGIYLEDLFVEPHHRGKGIGKALLLAALEGLREMGYVYAIIGAAGPVRFYQKTVGAIIIPDSEPGIYTDMLKR